MRSEEEIIKAHVCLKFARDMNTFKGEVMRHINVALDVLEDVRNGRLIDANATAAGMNRLVKGENVKDTVKK
jgi:hypothetical protein